MEFAGTQNPTSLYPLTFRVSVKPNVTSVAQSQGSLICWTTEPVGNALCSTFLYYFFESLSEIESYILSGVRIVSNDWSMHQGVGRDSLMFLGYESES